MLFRVWAMYDQRAASYAGYAAGYGWKVVGCVVFGIVVEPFVRAPFKSS